MLCKRIRAGSGLGDSIYLQSVVRHLVSKGEILEVCSNYPDVFLPIKEKIKISHFSRENIQIIAHYTKRKNLPSKQFEDSCLEAGIKEKIELKLDWKTSNNEFVKKLKLSTKPCLVLLIYRLPMDRADGFAQELLPNPLLMNEIIQKLKEKYTIVLVGSGQAMFNYSGVDYDFSNKTSVSEMIDICNFCQAVFSYCSFMVPLAESLDKKSFFLWSGKGLRSQNNYIRTITPEKILYKPTSFFAVDTWHENFIEEKLNEFLR